jgi:hypothetical protein
VLQQVAVVARHLDDERFRAEAEPLDGFTDEALRVLDPGRGERREVGVLGEGLLRRDQRRKLREQALVADPHVQRVGDLGTLRGVRREEQLARRGGSEIQEASELCRTAEPARDEGRGGWRVTRMNCILGQHCGAPPIVSRR